MRMLVILFISLTMRDVFSLPGQFSAEVSILGEGDIHPDTKPQVTCTISSIKPVSADVKFLKYIASDEEVAAKSSTWRDNSTAKTFEECADAAAASGSKMFLFDDQMCQISDDVYERSDYCGKDHSQMVYMNDDAASPTAPDNSTVGGFFCNYDWTVSCITGKCINYLENNGNSCQNNLNGIYTVDGRYHLLESGYEVHASTHFVECEKHGAQPCAPKDESSISQLLDDLADGLSIVAVGLNSTELNGYTRVNFMWASGVAMPSSHSGWQAGELFGRNCGILSGNKVITKDCRGSEYFCCMVPYYVN